MNEITWLSHGGPGSGRYPKGSGEHPRGELRKRKKEIKRNINELSRIMYKIDSNNDLLFRLQDKKND